MKNGVIQLSHFGESLTWVAEVLVVKIESS
jgi:hypothetical protein